MLLVARTLCAHFALPHPSTQEILAATGASKSRAYALCAALLLLLPTLLRPRGRPSQPSAAAPPPSPGEAVAAAVLNYVKQHPGCMRAHGKRQGYSDKFRSFIVQLREQHQGLALDLFARSCMVPLGTLKPWLAKPNAAPCPEATVSNDEPADNDGRQHQATLAQIQTVISAWKTWDGTFVDFTNYVRDELRVPMGRSLIVRILEACNVRLRRKRGGRSPDELALRDAFKTFFPGAQWVGDGKTVRVTLDGEPFTFNLELEVDAHSAAWVGLAVSDAEDSDAVIDSFKDGIATTGAPPLAELLDNKPANHTPEVDAELEVAGTMRIRSTPQRPQNKAHVEGAFGLFSQNVPPINLNINTSRRNIARSLLLLVAMSVARVINHRPRADRGGRSRAELYADEPTPEQIEQARAALKDICHRQEQARLTAEARQRPEVRALLDEYFERLDLLDPKRHIRVAIARHPLDAIVEGIAIFTGKRNAGTLPEGVDARYLLGIVRNLALQHEGERVAEALLATRLRARDLMLEGLQRQRAAVCDPSRAGHELVHDYVDRALACDRSLDRLFWLSSLADAIEQRAAADDQRHTLFAAAARRINTTYRSPPQERQAALRLLAARLVPLG